MSIAAAEALALHGLVVPTPNGIASRVLGKTSGGSLTLFAFDAGQGLTEHTSPYDAFAIVLEGTFIITIGSTSVEASAGTIVRMPAHTPHAVDAETPSRMLLVMMKEQQQPA
jgi:quercetin dioxygenase-like cupin family protein